MPGRPMTTVRLLTTFQRLLNFMGRSGSIQRFSATRLYVPWGRLSGSIIPGDEGRA
jgi:hypothetical protein